MPKLGRRLFFVVIGAALVISAAVALLAIGNGRTWDFVFTLHRSLDLAVLLREKFLGYGAAAPFYYILLQMAQVILAPLPGEATGALGGYLFGGWGGFWYSTVALSLGSWVAFVLGRLFGNVFPDRFRESDLYCTFNTLVLKNDYVIPFVLFLFPGFPKDSLCYLLGMSRMPFASFLFVAVVGRLPGTLLLSFQGAQIYERDYLKLALLLLLAAAITLPCLYYRHSVLAWLGRRTPTALSLPEGEK